MKMKQSSSTAQNMIEEVKVRAEVVFRSDALESEDKGVPAFAAVIPLSSQEQLFLSGASSTSVELSCWIFPEAPEVHSCLCKLEFLYAVCIQPSWKGMMGMSGNEDSWIFYSYSQHFAAVIPKRYSSSLPCDLFFHSFVVDCLKKTRALLPFWGLESVYPCYRNCAGSKMEVAKLHVVNTVQNFHF